MDRSIQPTDEEILAMFRPGKEPISELDSEDEKETHPHIPSAHEARGALKLLSGF